MAPSRLLPKEASIAGLWISWDLVHTLHLDQEDYYPQALLELSTGDWGAETN